MARLFFKQEFFAAIREGRKRATLRRWKNPRVAAGKRAFAPGVGWLRITACDRVNLKMLRATDARADGFSSLTELRTVLRQLYPKPHNDGRSWYRVSFHLEESQFPSPKLRCGCGSEGELGVSARWRLARRIRCELDKAVARSGSLCSL